MMICMFFIAAQLLQATFVYWLLNKTLQEHERQQEEAARHREQQSTLYAQSVPEPIRRIQKAREVNLRRRRRVVYDVEEELERVKEKELREQKVGLLRDWLAPLFAVERFLFEPTALRTSPRYLPMKVDAISRVLFPLTFILVSGAYWALLYALKD